MSVPRLQPAAERPLRVVIAECNFLVREGLYRVLEQCTEFTVAAVCTDVDAAREAVRETRPDVLLTAIRMPPTYSDEGVALAAELARTSPDVAVVVLSRFLREEYARRVFSASTQRRAYISKARLGDRDYLIDVLRRTAAGQPTLDSAVVQLMTGAATPANDPFRLLTADEETVLGALAAGSTNNAIAAQLGVPPRVIERHVNSIFQKLELPESGAVNRRVLAAVAFARHQAVQAG
jgi:DNA-binding NarL/FixJ family response regulator